MFKKLFSLFAALTLSVGLWADDVITYTATMSLQDLFNNQEKFEPAPMSNDYAEGIGTVTFSNLMEIRNEAFKDCSALTSITLPASIQNIGDFAFANCEHLESITCKASFPPNCSPSAFESVPFPIPLYVPASSIEAYQMAVLGNLFEVQALPVAVGDQFKDETTGLNFEITSLGTPKTVKVIQNKFMNYSNSSYNIPSSVTYSNVEYTVTEIGDHAFYNCGDVTSITLPSTITTIEEDAFCFCVFSSIDLPAALTAIGNYAFSGCKNLQSIIVPANVTTIDYNAFAACAALASVTFLGNACQNAIGNNVFNKVGATEPALLTLPDNWTGTLPDEDGKWYGGKFELSSIPGLTTYLDENGEEQNIDAFEVKDASDAVTWGTAGETTWFVVNGTNVQLAKGAICAGDVRLILADNAKLTATGGINVTGTNSLTIYGQSTGDEMGQLIADATSVESAAGIGGGGYEENGSNITINGGIITATGGEYGAGIGGGEDGIGSNITINGGIITANGGDNGAGIGGGYEGSGSNITINGGKVIARSESRAAGIGGGEGGSGSYITINGGTVEATGEQYGAGIGGGRDGAGSNIIINGGVVDAYGGGTAAGIGGGNNGYGSNITILAGTVTATSEYAGAGIGGGENGFGSDITINGGTVTANGGEGAAGIGGGNSGTGSNIYISDAYVLKAGAAENPTDVIAHSSAQDIASSLNGKQYAKIEGLATPYTRTVGANNWATVCLPYAATSFEGAEFYKVNYYDASNPSDLKLYIEPVDNLLAGMPYIFQATADVVTIYHSATAPEAVTAGDENGLYGSFARKTIESDGDMAALSDGEVVVVDNGGTVTVPACRAYLDMNEVPTVEQPHSAPLRVMGVPRSTPTNNENVNADGNMNGKFIINGRLVIVKDGKKINALGF